MGYMQRLHPFICDLSAPGFWYPRGVLEPIPCGIPRDNYTSPSCLFYEATQRRIQTHPQKSLKKKNIYIVLYLYINIVLWHFPIFFNVILKFDFNG